MVAGRGRDEGLANFRGFLLLILKVNDASRFPFYDKTEQRNVIINIFEDEQVKKKLPL